MRPRRRVVETDTGFEVTCSGFTSSDRVLALAVRDELDRVDPLPCPHDGDTVEIRQVNGHGWIMCSDCGAELVDDVDSEAFCLSCTYTATGSV
ncbi:hypothetical protein PIS_052 [Saccharomonospora phage PIS 136]|nr:hypothetical protein PIS_052 [Saccharomonospora phage PIS 136]